jgi:hypothetical protein
MPRFCGVTIESFDFQLGLNGQPGELRVYCVEDAAGGDVPVIPAADTPVSFSFGSLVFGGLLQQWGKELSTSGERYTFTAVDPTALLEAATVITGGYAAAITGANVLNVYGYAGFVGGDPNASGMPWATVLSALTDFFAGVGAPYGAPVAYRGGSYTVDLSELPVMPTGYRVPGGVSSLAELVAQVCNDAQLDYFVRLNGLVVEIKTRSRAAAATLGGTLSVLAGLSYAGLVARQSVGVEASRVPTGMVLLGGPKSELLLATTFYSYWGDDATGAPVVGAAYSHPDLPGEPCESFTLACDHIADAVGAATYATNTVELRCALGGYNSWSLYVKKYRSASDAEKAVGVLEAVGGALAKVDMLRDARDQMLAAMNEASQTRAMVIYNWLRAVAEEFFGKRFLVRLSGVYATGYERYSARVDSGAWVTGGAGALGLGALDQDKFSDADGRISAFAEVRDIDTLDPNEVDPSTTAVVGTSLLVRAQVDGRLIQSGGHVYAKVDLGDPVFLRERPDGGDVFRIIDGLGAGNNAHQAGGTLGSLAVNPHPKYPAQFGVPLTSELETYGPWSALGAEGKVDLVQDDGLVPWEYGGETEMDVAANARVAGAASLQTTAEWAEATFAGIPLASPGDVLVSGGPTLTQVSVNYSTGGLTTTYRFAANTSQRPANIGRQVGENIRRAAAAARTGREKAVRALARAALSAEGRQKAKSNRAFRKNAPGWVRKESPQEVVVASVVSTTGGYRTHAALTTAEEGLAVAFPTGDDAVWRDTALSSWSAVVRPFEVTGPTGSAAGLLPPLRMVSALTGGNAGAVTAAALSHLEGPHDIEVLSWGASYTGANARARNPSATGSRSVGLRGPVVVQGWGPGLDGRVYPTGTSSAQYLSDHRRRPDQGKAGYLDPLWDEKRGLWTVHDVYTGTAPTGIAAGDSASVRVGGESDWTLPVHAPFGAVPSGGSVVFAYAANEGRLVALPRAAATGCECTPTGVTQPSVIGFCATTGSGGFWTGANVILSSPTGTSCLPVQTCPTGGCPTVWYCTTTGAAGYPVGPTPTGIIGPPYPTLATAQANCPYTPTGGVATCCGRALNATLYLTLSSGPVVPLVWDGANWVGSEVLGGCTVTFTFYTSCILSYTAPGATSVGATCSGGCSAGCSPGLVAGLFRIQSGLLTGSACTFGNLTGTVSE